MVSGVSCGLFNNLASGFLVPPLVGLVHALTRAALADPDTWRRIDNNRGIAMALVQGELVQRQVGGSDSSPVPAAFGSAGLHPAP